MRSRLLFTAALLAMIVPSVASAQCTRHAYNRSKLTWWFVGVTAGATCMSSTGRSGAGCVIPPGQTAVIKYDGSRGGIVIYSRDLERRYIFSGCYINHSGDTGRIVLNDPAAGDVKLTGN